MCKESASLVVMCRSTFKLSRFAHATQFWLKATSAASTVLLYRQFAVTRPLRITFKSLDAKHGFFRFNKALRSAGIRVDDDLTPTQQKERKELDGDFAQLKSRGHRPYFRGSVLFSACACWLDAHGSERTSLHKDGVGYVHSGPSD